MNADLIDTIDEVLNESRMVISFENEYENTQQIVHKQFLAQTKLHSQKATKSKIGAFDCKLLRYVARLFQSLFTSKDSLKVWIAFLLIWLLSCLFDDNSFIIIGVIGFLTFIIIKLFNNYDKSISIKNQEHNENFSFIENGLFVECSQISLNPGDIILVGYRAYIFEKLSLSHSKQKKIKLHNNEVLNIAIFKRARNCFDVEDRINLSANFAEDLIKAEMEFELYLSLENFSQLIQLYTYALKFYENIKESKRKFFKHRLQSLLSKIDLLKLTQSQFQYLEDENQKHHRMHTKQRRLKQINHPFDDTYVNYGFSGNGALVIHEIKAEEAIAMHQKSNILICSKAQENMKNQSEGLKIRVGKRKQTVLNQSFSLNMSNISDRSDLEDFEVKFELYQIELENTMDQFVDKAINKTLEIKAKYKEVLKNLDSIENVLIQTKRRVETERAMQLEIDEVNKKIDEEKKQTILELRQKFKLI